MKDLLKIFGERVKALRKAQGLSQEALAEKADLHYTYVGGIERGERNPSLKNIGRIAEALHTDAGEFFIGIALPKSSRNGTEAAGIDDKKRIEKFYKKIGKVDSELLKICKGINKARQMLKFK